MIDRKAIADELTRMPQEDGLYDMKGKDMRISIRQYRQNEGLEDEEAWTSFVNQLVMDSVCPALCDEYCEVEPDGRCEHDCPSILLALGLI